MGYVIIPRPQFSSREGINSHRSRFAGRGHLCDLSRKAPPGAVVVGPTGRSRSTMTALTGFAGSFK